MIVLDGFSVHWGRTRLSRPLSSRLNANCLLINGETGCGKSSCLRALLGIGRFRHSGAFTVDGSPVISKLWNSPALGLAYLPQEPIDARELSLEEFLAIGRGTLQPFLGIPRIRLDGRRWVREALSTFCSRELSPLRDLARPYRNLNFAHTRYAALLRLRLDSASLALLDEPFEGLGEELRELALSILDVSFRKGLTAVVVDHLGLVSRCQNAVIGAPQFEWTYGE